MAEILKPSFLSNTWARTGAKVEPSNSKKDIGWVPEIPTAEMFNWILNRQDEFNAHINQMGIPIWDTSTEYIANKSFVQSSTGNIYRATQDSININPETDTTSTYWKLKSTQSPSLASLAPGYTHSANSSLNYMIVDGCVNINGGVLAGTGFGAIVTTLPSRYRPNSPRVIPVSVFDGSVTTSATAVINTSGTIQLINTVVAVGRTYYFAGVFPL